MAVLIIGLALLGVLGAMVYVGMQEDRGGDALQDRLAFYGENDLEVESLEDVELSLSFKDRIILPIVERLANFTGRFTPQKQLEEAAKMIELAGLDLDPQQFFLQRIMYTVLLGIGGFVIGFFLLPADMPIPLIWTFGGIGLGYYFKVMSLKGQIKRRQNEIQKALPDALDLLVICVEAGLGFDAAMGKVYEKWDNELALAFGRVLREIQLGKLRRDALKNMADRMDVPDVSTFVAAIIQAEALGVSMSRILRVQSDQMRVKRRQRAQERAQQAPVKMMLPMVLLIFPSIWVVLMGPAALILLGRVEQ